MTNVAVWKNPKTKDIWAVADTRVSRGHRLTDQASKLLPLSVDVSFPIDVVAKKLEYQSFWGLGAGFCYAGAVLPALLTHSALKVLLESLGGPKGTKPPTMRTVAELAKYVAERYTKDIAIGYPIDDPPLFEFIILGTDFHCETDKALLLRPKVTPSYHLTIEELDLDGGEVGILGSEKEALLSRIEELRRSPRPDWAGVEPRIAIEERIRAGTHPTVGGTLQFGILEGGRFRTFAASVDLDGKFNRNYLGFDIDKEIAPILGVELILPALR